MFSALGTSPCQQQAVEAGKPHPELHHQQQHSQTEVSTGSASLAAASGLLAIAGTAAGGGKAGHLLGSSESDGTPHPDHHEHSIPSADPASPQNQSKVLPHQLQQPHLQQLHYHTQQPLMLLQQQQMLLHFQAAAGFQAMTAPAYAVPGQPAAANSAAAIYMAQHQQHKGQAAVANAAASVTTAQPQMTTSAGLPVIAFPGLSTPNHLVQMSAADTAGTAADGPATAAAGAGSCAVLQAGHVGSSPLQPAGMGRLMQMMSPAAYTTDSAATARAAATAGLPPKPDPDGPHPSRRGLALRGPCFHCGTTISSQWRSGPADKPVLCNACGLYYRKVQSLPDHTCQVAGALSGPCGHCGADESPQWRAGPPEHPVLCDPCGRHFRKTKTLPKRKRRSLAQHFAGCHHCGSQFSPQWRGGPPDKPTLCNACGLHFRKTKSLPERPVSQQQQPDKLQPEDSLMDLSRAAAEQQRRDDAAAGLHSAHNATTDAATAGAAPADVKHECGLGGVLQDGDGHHAAASNDLHDAVEDGFMGAAAAVAAAMSQPGWPATEHTTTAGMLLDHHAADTGLTPMAAAVDEAVAPFASPQLPDPADATAGAEHHEDDVVDTHMLSALVDEDQHAMLAAFDDPVAAAAPQLDTATPRATTVAAAAAAAAARAAHVGVAASGSAGNAVPAIAGTGAAIEAAAAAGGGGDGGGCDAICGETAESSCTEPQAPGIATSQGPPAVNGGIAEGIPVVPGPLMPHLHPMAVSQPHLSLMQQHSVPQGPAVGVTGPVSGAAAAAPAGWPCLPPQGVPGWGPLGYGPGAMQPGMFGMPAAIQPGFAAGAVMRPPGSSGAAAAAQGMPAPVSDTQQQQQQQQQNGMHQLQQQTPGQQPCSQPLEHQPQHPQPQQPAVAHGTALQPYDHLHMAGLQMAPMIHYNWHQAYQMQQQQYMQLMQQQQQQQHDGSKAGIDSQTGSACQVAPGMPALSVTGQPVMAPAAAGGAGLHPQGPTSQGASLLPSLNPIMPGFGPMGMMDPNFQVFQQQQWQQWQQQSMMQQQMFMQQQHLYYQQQLHMQQQQAGNAQQQLQQDPRQIATQQQEQQGGKHTAVPGAPGAEPDDATVKDEAAAVLVSPANADITPPPAAAADATTPGLAYQPGFQDQSANPQSQGTCVTAQASSSQREQQTAEGVPAATATAGVAATAASVAASWRPTAGVPGPVPGVNALSNVTHPYGHMCIPQPPTVIVMCKDNNANQQRHQQAASATQQNEGDDAN